MLPELLAERERLQALASAAGELEEEMQAHLSRYICVRTCGFLERSVEAVLSAYSVARAQPEVAGYVTSALADFRTPSWENLKKLVGRFGLQWQLSDPIKGHLASIVTQRHQIAHGRYAVNDLSLVRMQEYLASAVSLVEDLHRLCELK